MNIRTTLSVVALAALGLAAAHPAAAQSTITLTNGALIGGDGTYNGTSNSVAGFSGTENYGYAFGSHDTGSGKGLYINRGSVYQFLGHTGAAGETLTLNGLIGNFQAGPGRPYAVGSAIEFTSAAPTPSNYLGTGSILTSEALTPPADGTYTGFGPLTYTSTVANQDVYLVLGGPDTSYGQYDRQTNYANLSLTDTPGASAAPEPSQLAGLGFTVLGALGLMLKARKRTGGRLGASA